MSLSSQSMLECRKDRCIIPMKAVLYNGQRFETHDAYATYWKKYKSSQVQRSIVSQLVSHLKRVL